MQFNLAKFIPLLFIVLILVPFQTSIEEILSRIPHARDSYPHKSRWIALIVVSLLFG